MNNNSRLFISFSGIDGAGKSSIAYELQSYLLKRHNIKCHVIWCKFGNYPINQQLHQVITRLRLVDKNPFVVHSKNNIRKSSSFFYQVYGRILFYYHLLEIYIKVCIPLFLGISLICDRYIYDTMVDLQQEFGYSFDRTKNIFSKSWVSKPDYKFLLDLPVNVAFKRKTDTKSEAFLIERKKLYLDIASAFELTIIDASQTPQQIIEKTLQIIET